MNKIIPCPFCRKADKLIQVTALLVSQHEDKYGCERCGYSVNKNVWESRTDSYKKEYSSLNLQKKYLRNTHNPDGSYRKDMQEKWDQIPDTFGGVIHLLDPREPMDIYDIIRESHSYGKDWPLENNCGVETNPFILQDILTLLVNVDMVKVVEP